MRRAPVGWVARLAMPAIRGVECEAVWRVPSARHADVLEGKAERRAAVRLCPVPCGRTSPV